MQDIASILNFVKSIGGPRNLAIIVLLIILGGVLLYQYSGSGSKEDSGSDDERSRGKLRDILIAGLAVVLVVSFLAMVFLFLYLIFLA
jgi:ABC-type Fe3+ transport system permease subunit